MSRPIVGFFGLIERWIDLDLVDYLAEQRPQWTFLLIGRLAVPDHDVLPDVPNMHFMGKRPYAESARLRQAVRRGDHSLSPDASKFHANPLKLREYLAMGKPIVSVRTPEIEKYGDVVEIADIARGVPGET